MWHSRESIVPATSYFRIVLPFSFGVRSVTRDPEDANVITPFPLFTGPYFTLLALQANDSCRKVESVPAERFAARSWTAHSGPTRSQLASRR